MTNLRGRSRQNVYSNSAVLYFNQTQSSSDACWTQSVHGVVLLLNIVSVRDRVLQRRRSLSTVGGTHSDQSTPPPPCYCPPLMWCAVKNYLLILWHEVLIWKGDFCFLGEIKKIIGNDYELTVMVPAGMRVDLSPRLGGIHSGQSTPQYCPPLIHLHSLPPCPRNSVRSHSRCGTESWTELELAFHLTVTFLIRLQGPNDSLH